MEYRQATDADLAKIEELLKDNNLPFSDCGEHIDSFIIKEIKNTIIGIGCIEIYGNHGLIRSIVVAQNHRGNGIAKDKEETGIEYHLKGNIIEVVTL